MLESYVIARDRFLGPNGKMFPTVGRIHMAPFSDEYLFRKIEILLGKSEKFDELMAAAAADEAQDNKEQS